MSLNNRLQIVLFLFFSPLLSNCTDNKSESIGSITEVEVILDKNINFVTRDQIEASIVKFRIRGINEPFFETIEIHGSVPGKIPRSKNLLLILESGSPLFNSTFAELFDPQFIRAVNSSNKPITLIKNDLFYLGQTVYIILMSPGKVTPSKFLNSLSQLINKMILSSIKSLRREDFENFNYELSHSLADSLQISIKIPPGFELIPLKNYNSSVLMRRGVGTKTEEWITVTSLSDSFWSPRNEIDFKQLRDNLQSKLIKFSDGSLMTTNSAVRLDTEGKRFRGEWVTEPYPIAGFYSGKFVESKKGIFYIEAGIYSPGRSKTLNLLRLENILNFNR